MPLGSIEVIAMRRAIRRCSVPFLYSVKSWSVFARRRSMISDSQFGSVAVRVVSPCARAIAFCRTWSLRAPAISATGRTKSTIPVWIALRGMPS